MQAAFVDIGLGRDTFLYVTDFFEDYEDYDDDLLREEEEDGEALRLVDQLLVQAPDRDPSRPLLYLLPAGDAHHSHLPLLPFGGDSGKEALSANVHRDVVMLFLISKGSCHAATARVNHIYMVSRI